jgi:hypothetical protein
MPAGMAGTVRFGAIAKHPIGSYLTPRSETHGSRRARNGRIGRQIAFKFVSAAVGTGEGTYIVMPRHFGDRGKLVISFRDANLERLQQLGTD